MVSRRRAAGSGREELPQADLGLLFSLEHSETLSPPPIMARQLSHDGFYNTLTVSHLNVIGTSNISGATTTLGSIGGTQSLVIEGTGPNLTMAGLTAGDNVTLSYSEDTGVTIASSGGSSVTTLGSTGGTSLVSNGTGPALEILGLTAGANITLTPGEESITIAATGGGGGDTTATYLTQAVETMNLPNSFQLVAGTNITLTPVNSTLVVTGTPAPSLPYTISIVTAAGILPNVSAGSEEYLAITVPGALATDAIYVANTAGTPFGLIIADAYCSSRTMSSLRWPITLPGITLLPMRILSN